jgi:hypothetical protein
MSSPNNPTILSCFGCNKLYKSRAALLKHQSKCSATTIENITTDITENITPTDNTRGNITETADNDIIPPEIQREFKEQLQALMNSKEPPPRAEPIKSETILVNTAVIDSLMKSVITELFDHQHKQMQTILAQNKKLAEENKMLIKVLRSIVLTKHQDGTLGHIQCNNDDDDNNNNNNDDNNDNNNDDNDVA